MVDITTSLISYKYMISHGPGSIVGIVTGYGLDGPGIESRWGARFSAPIQTGPRAHPASCTMDNRSFPGVKNGQGVTLSPHPLLVPWSWKGRAIPLLPLWAVQPVQSLSACTRVNFTFFTLYDKPKPVNLRNCLTSNKCDKIEVKVPHKNTPSFTLTRNKR